MSEESLSSKTKKGLFWKAFDTFANAGMQFVVGIVMARLLTPEDYGITALPAVFMAIASTFVDGSFGLALIRKPEVTEKDLSTSFIYSIGMGIFMYAVLFLCAPLIATFYNTPVLTPLIRITALTFIWSPLATPQIVILRRKLDFKTPARIAIVNNIVAGVVGISIAYLGYGLWALVASSISSSILNIIQMWIVVKWLPKARFDKESFRYLWGFGNRMIATNLLNTLYENIAPVIIGKYYSPKQLGFYNRAQSFSSLPIMHTTNIVRTVSFPVLSKLLDDKEQLTLYYRKMIRTTCYIIFPVMFLIAALAKPIVIILLTEKWLPCVFLLQLLCFSAMWGPIGSLNLNILQVSGRTDLYFNMELIKKGFSLIILAISLPFGIEWFCASSIIIQFFCVYMNIKNANKVLPIGYFSQIKDILPSFIISAIVFGIVLMLIMIITAPLLQIIIGGIIGVSIYLCIGYFLKLEELYDAWQLIKRH